MRREFKRNWQDCPDWAVMSIPTRGGYMFFECDVDADNWVIEQHYGADTEPFVAYQ